MIVDHNKFRLFDYINNPSKDDEFILGEVVYKESENAIGVIIQCHGNNEYRTDQFGNCCFDKKYGDIEKAKLDKIKEVRPQIITDLSEMTRTDETVELFDDRMCMEKSGIMFYPEEPYQAIILNNHGHRQALVNGVIFSGEEFDNEFKLR